MKVNIDRYPFVYIEFSVGERVRVINGDGRVYVVTKFIPPAYAHYRPWVQVDHGGLPICCDDLESVDDIENYPD